MTRPEAIHHFHEKIATGLASLAAAGLSYLGAILTDGEVRWVCITLASSILTATFTAVIVRAPSETMRLTVARAGFAILAGVLGTRELLIRWGMEAFEHDAIRLAGWSAAMTIGGLVLGYPLLLLLNTRGKAIAKLIADKFTPK